MTSDPGRADDTEPFGGVAPSDSTAETDATGGLSTDQKPAPGPLFGGRLALVLTLMRSRVVRIVYLVTVLALLAAALADQAGTLWNEVQRLSAPVVVGAFFAGLFGLLCNMMVWRSALAGLGSRLSIPEAWRIMFIGQLGKYVPGSIWPVLAQSELGADLGIPRHRSAVSVLLGYAVATCSGLVVACVTLPFAAGSFGRYFWVLFILPVVVALLSPPVLNRMLGVLLKLTRQPELEKPVSIPTLARAMAWAIASWSFNGVMTYVLLRQLAGDGKDLLLVSFGAYALSWVVGFLAVFAPAGAGVREAVMVATLGTHTTTAIALAVALFTRAIAVVCDAATGAAAAALIGRRRMRRLRESRGQAQPSPTGAPSRSGSG